MPLPPSNSAPEIVRIPPDRLQRLSERLSPPPRSLFGRGNLALLDQPAVAIVGSRRASDQGLADARWFAAELSAQGLVVVSGLALGIDGAAHRGCLKAGGKTIAVLAHGLDQVYPPHHQGLAQAILDGDGLLLSEYPAGTPARPFQFLRRNQIIAGLSESVCLIEAAEGSGSLSTAMGALEQGSEVCVVPGPIHGGLYAGGHRLIRQGASLVQSPDDLLEDLGRLPPQSRSRPQRTARPHRTAQARFEDFDDPRAEAVQAALSVQASGAEQIAQRAQLSLGDALAGLLMLELSGQAVRHPDGLWARFRPH